MLNETQDQIRRVEVTLEEARATVDRAKSLEKLRRNRDFKKIFDDYYFDKEIKRLVSLKADPTQQYEETQKSIDIGLNSVGYLQQFLNAITQGGALAERAIVDHENTLDELREEDLEGTEQ